MPGRRPPRAPTCTASRATKPRRESARSRSWPGTSSPTCPAPSGPSSARVRETLTQSEAETEALAAELAAAFRGGEVVLLSGELGAGKTVFVRGLARGVGADPEEVASPTFVLLTRYPGRLTLHHADLYRLAGGGDDLELGLEELPGPGGVLAVEWAERISVHPRVPPLAVRASPKHAGVDKRRGRIA